ncbi:MULTISPECIES: hypothetical protein [unclassified Sedimentibacter]|uniref:hypothetical protein n=1 Tax=unclassified Sedimentibacter TaxID=2649220 RepID=UPI0027E200B7|nr:hypothetical protein [Sedimentibacter sp. MB35-C1]WMJ77483.1 hypothetical protein RBQ61_00710 [Sedimentibacter sp. MB35-C1]
MKAKIDLGIPVLLHCTGTGEGVEHWVVVYGYKEAGTAKSDFLVIDSANTTQGTTTPNYGRYDTLTGAMSWSYVTGDGGVNDFTLKEAYYVTANN